MLRSFLIIIFSTILVTLTVNATDNIGNLSNSMLGTVASALFSKQQTPCPSDMVFVATGGKSFCIDRYENSPGDDCFYRDPRNTDETRFDLDMQKCIPVSRADVLPWRNISHSQALTACAKAGKRVPTNEEWFIAALGTPDMFSSNRKNDCNIEKNWAGGGLNVSGSGSACVSSVGAYDMVGNVWEWVLETVDHGVAVGRTLPASGYVTAVDEKGIPLTTDEDHPDISYHEDYIWVDDTIVAASFRGGYWNSGSDAGVYTLHAGVAPSFSGVGVGFRCVKNLEE